MRHSFNHFVCCADGRVWQATHATQTSAMQRHQKWTRQPLTLRSWVIEVDGAGATIAVLADWQAEAAEAAMVLQR